MKNIYWGDVIFITIGGFVLILLIIAGVIRPVYKAIAPSPIMTLSDGVMISKSAKLSHKGYIWKTWDGWIPVGVNSEGGLKQWYFTVKDGNQTIIDCIDSGSKVKLHYKDYVWMPYRKGNSHQVDGCEILE